MMHAFYFYWYQCRINLDKLGCSKVIAFVLRLKKIYYNDSFNSIITYICL